MPENVILVTGATGFLGRHLVSALRARGYIVVASARRRVPDMEADQWVLGDLRDEKIQEAAVKGCAFVVNAAGLVKKAAPEVGWEKDMFDLNSEMVESLAKVSERFGVARFLQISSTGVYGPFAPQICNETSECLPGDAYEKSKFAGEQRLMALAKGRMQIVIVRPSNIFGEGHPWNKLLSWMKAVGTRRLVLAGNPDDAIVNYVYVGDVTDAAIRLLECQRISGGEIFNINTPATMSQFQQATAQAVGCPGARPRVVPRKALIAAATTLDWISRLTGSKFPLSLGKVAELTGNRMFSSERLTAMCPGFPRTGLSEGLSRLAAHYHFRRLL